MFFAADFDAESTAALASMQQRMASLVASIEKRLGDKFDSQLEVVNKRLAVNEVRTCRHVCLCFSTRACVRLCCALWVWSCLVVILLHSTR